MWLKKIEILFFATMGIYLLIELLALKITSITDFKIYCSSSNCYNIVFILIMLLAGVYFRFFPNILLAQGFLATFIAAYLYIHPS